MSSDLEKIILGSLIHVNEFRAKVQPFAKSELFSDSAITTSIDIIRDYSAKYNSFPNETAMIIELDAKSGLSENVYQSTKKLIPSLFSEDMRLAATKLDKTWILDKTEKYLKTRSCHNAVMDSISILDGENKKLTPDAIPDILKAALSISFDVNVGHDYIDDYESRFEFYHKVEKTIPFRLSVLNASITGTGIPRKSLVVPVAPTGVGKSLFLTDWASYLITKQYNVLYVTLELSEERVAERMDANLMDMTMGTLKTCPMNTFNSKIMNLKKNPLGKIKIKEYPPGTFTANHLRFLLNEYLNKTGFVPDVIMIDYLNLMASYRMKDPGNSYQYIKAIAEELRGVAMEFDCVVAAPTQTNRSGQNATDFELNEVSESHGISMTADVMLGLISTPDLENLGHIRFKLLKNRFGQTGNSFVASINRAKMQIRDLDMTSGPSTPNPSTQLNNTKGKTTGLKF